MSDKPDNPAPAAPPNLTVRDPSGAPHVFFDGAPTFGFSNGIVGITLAASRHLLTDGAPVADAVAVAYLRCNIPAAIELRNALDKALLAASKPQGATH